MNAPRTDLYPRFDLYVHGARLVTCAGDGLDPLGIIEGGAVGMREGRLTYVGDHDASLLERATTSYDAAGRLVLPGLVDPHTHLVFGGSRIDEFARKMAGEDYRSIAASGGGILSTVRATRGAPDEALLASATARARTMASHGVTAIEIKSGYGLGLEEELRILRVARAVAASAKVRTFGTLLGAHAVPPEHASDRAGYVRLVAEQMIPAAAEEGLAHAVDVYLDQNAFTVDEARVVLEAARARGLVVRAHVGQFADIGGAEAVAALGARSADHLEHVSDAGLDAMAAAGTVAVLLPGAWRTLRQAAPDARRIRAHGVRVAIGTDCNPGTSPTTDLWLCAALAVRDAGLEAREAILGVTAWAADAIGADDIGRLRVGHRADLAIFDHDDPRALVYGLGDTYAAGRIVGGGPAVEETSSLGRLW